MSSDDSEITGLQKLGSVLERFVGTSPSAGGLTTRSPDTADLARDWLLRQANPGEADAALRRSLISLCGAMASMWTEGRYPSNGAAYTVAVGCDWDIVDPTRITEIRQRIQGAMTPPTPAQAEAWLVMLQAACAHRSDSDAALAVAYELYSGALQRFPADVAKAACEKLARGKSGQTNWFPTYAELMDMCERLAAPRQIMLASLRTTRSDGQPEWKPPTKAERERVRLMAEEIRRELTKPPVHPPHSWYQAPVDEGGLIAEMRAHIAAKNGPDPRDPTHGGED